MRFCRNFLFFWLFKSEWYLTVGTKNGYFFENPGLSIFFINAWSESGDVNADAHFFMFFKKLIPLHRVINLEMKKVWMNSIFRENFGKFSKLSEFLTMHSKRILSTFYLHSVVSLFLRIFLYFMIISTIFSNPILWQK